MGRKVLTILLFLLEMIVYYLICSFFNFDFDLTVGSGGLYFLFLFVYGHFYLESCLIWDEIQSLTKSSICFMIALFMLVPLHLGYRRRLHLGMLVIIMFFTCLFLNRTLRILLRNSCAKRTLVIGTDYEARRIGKVANNNRFALTKVVGYIDINHTDKLYGFKQKNMIKRTPVFEYDNIDEAIRINKAQQIILALPKADKKVIDKIMNDIYDKVDSIKYLPNVNGMMTFSSKIQDFDGQLLIATSNDKMNIFDKFIKRCIDIVAGIVGSLLCIPLIGILKLKFLQSGDTGPVIFTQERVGLHGKPIKIYKIRSMVMNAEQILEELMEKDPEIKKEYLKDKKLAHDPRVTPLGHILRKSSLDEFPQFFNVLKGEMSLVGPRPYLPREIPDMGVYYKSVIQCKPGITGMWQANGRSDVNFHYRCKLDDFYYRNWSIWLDFIIIYKTVKAVVYGKGSL